MPFSVHFPGWQTRYPRLSASAHSNWTGPSRAAVFSAFPFSFYHLPAAVLPLSDQLSLFPAPLHTHRYLVVFNPIEQERLCTVTVLVNTVKVRVLTEDGQTLPVQLSAQWSSASQMSAEVFEVWDSSHFFGLQAAFKPKLKVGRFRVGWWTQRLLLPKEALWSVYFQSGLINCLKLCEGIHLLKAGSFEMKS